MDLLLGSVFDQRDGERLGRHLASASPNVVAVEDVKKARVALPALLVKRMVGWAGR